MSSITRSYESRMPASAEELAGWHANPGALQRLTPPWLDVRFDQVGGISQGETVRVQVPIAGPLRVPWELVHEDLADGQGFADVQVSGPFGSWRHEHRFNAVDTDSSVLVDRLTCELPAG